MLKTHTSWNTDVSMMPHSLLFRPVVLIAVVLLWPAPLPGQGRPKGWFAEMAPAIAAAKKERKDLLIEFTGNDWCPYCEALKWDVFELKDVFQKLQPHFVLVELDFPGDKSKRIGEKYEDYRRWQKRFSQSGFPTVYLADAEGRPYTELVGYDGEGAKLYLERLLKRKTIRRRRDAALAKAASSEGIQKAKHLDAALCAMQGEFILSAYQIQIEQIISLDADGSLGLRTKYQNLRQKRKREQWVNKQVDDVYAMMGKKAPSEVMREVERLLKSHPDEPLLRKRLLKIKFRDLQARNPSAAMALLEKMLSGDLYNGNEKRQLGMDMARLLAEAKQVDQAVAVYDKLIRQAQQDPQAETGEIVEYAYMKGGMLLQHRPDSPLQALAAFEQAHELGSNRTHYRYAVPHQQTVLLTKLGRHRPAAAIYEKLLEDKRLTASQRLWWQVAEAEAHAALGEMKTARQLVVDSRRLFRQIEKELPESTRDDLLKRMEKLDLAQKP